MAEISQLDCMHSLCRSVLLVSLGALDYSACIYCTPQMLLS